MRVPRLSCAALLAAALCAAPAAAQNADEGGLAELLGEEVGSAASRTAQSGSEAPGTTWSISGTDLKRYGIQSVEEAIRYLGHAMTSYEFDQRQNDAFTGRGLSDATLGLHLAVLIDGNQAGGSSKTGRASQQYNMPIELIDHIEVVIGPGSVVYGNNAMLGVINVVTRTGESLRGTHAVVQASAGAPGDPWAKDLSWGEAWGRAAVYGGDRITLAGDPLDYAWHFGLRVDRQQGRSIWNGPNGDPYALGAAAYTREDVFNRDFGARLFARATYGHWTFHGWAAFTTGQGTGPIQGSGASTYSEPELGLDVAYNRPVFSRGDLSLRFYAVVFDSRATVVPFTFDRGGCLSKVGSPTCYDTLEYVSARPFIEPLFSWDWKQDGTHVTTLGGQFFLDGSFITPGTVSGDGSKSVSDGTTPAPIPNGALYAQHIWRGGFGTLNAGVRGDVGYLGTAISPRLAYSKDVLKDTTIKAVASTGFRTPTITERFLKIDGFLTDNPNIQPERVYSAELDLVQRLGGQNLQISLFGTYWDQMISTHLIPVPDGTMIQQFANLRSIASAGINLGWKGAKGPVDWALSLNYAPGRSLLPANVLSETDAQLNQDRLNRTSIVRYGTNAFGQVLMPVEQNPDFYATGHVSYSLGEDLPRVSVAANLNSPRPRSSYINNADAIDPRNLSSGWMPWTLDLRTAIEHQLNSRIGLRLIVTARTNAGNPSSPRVGTDTEPYPQGGIGAAANPVAPASAMLELNVRL
jgi:outer membrane receptor protein involved in Fe transport